MVVAVAFLALGASVAFLIIDKRKEGKENGRKEK